MEKVHKNIFFCYDKETAKHFVIENVKNVPIHYFSNFYRLKLILNYLPNTIDLADSMEVKEKVTSGAIQVMTEKKIWQPCDSFYLVQCLVQYLPEPLVEEEQNNSIDYSDPIDGEEVMVYGSEDENDEESFASESDFTVDSAYESSNQSFNSQILEEDEDDVSLVIDFNLDDSMLSIYSYTDEEFSD